MAHLLKAQVIENLRLPRRNYLLAVRAPEIAQATLPGQFVMAAKLEEHPLPYPLLKRALAVYSIRKEKGRKGVITLLLKVVGQGTRRLASLLPNDSLSLIGPLGNGFDLTLATGTAHVLIAGGIGIASMYLLAEQLTKRREQVRLIYGGRTAEDLVGLEDFQRLGIPVFVTTDDGSRGFKGLITQGLEEQLQHFSKDRMSFFCCGSNTMMQAVSAFATRYTIPCQVSVEARMACGFGVCLGCSVKTINSYRLACRDGPVFNSSEFLWEET